MADQIKAEDTAYVDNGDDVARLVLPGYRNAYAPYDFTDPEARSLDDEIAHYLSKVAMRHWWNPPQRLVLEIVGESRDPQREDVTCEAYRKMFGWRAQAAIYRFFRQLPLALTLVALGVVILWVSQQVSDTNMEEDVRHTLADVVKVGAWVALWSAISLLFQTGFSSLGSYIAFRRLGRIPVEFRYSKDSKKVDKQHRRALKSA